jgi:hypothetical protein
MSESKIERARETRGVRRGSRGWQALALREVIAYIKVGRKHSAVKTKRAPPPPAGTGQITRAGSLFIHDLI